jgi:hypothetical protein
MKPLFLFLLLPVAALAAGPFSAGIVGGLPMTDFLNTVQGTSSAVTNRYIVGPEAELNLPFGLGIEADALYRHFSYTNVIGSAGAALTSTGHAGDWEFPLVVKYKFPGKIARPYVEAGVAWDTLTGVTNTVSHFAGLSVSPAKNTVMGTVIGAGVDIHAIVVHVTPEVRYTRWTSQQYNVAGVLNSNQNQAEFLVGIRF